jgi:aminoglycoside phosphotransferase family enzyme/predicted kinase
MDHVITEPDIVAFLETPDVWGSGVSNVDVIETHISRVFMAGNRVLKLKRRVKFPYLDFSLIEQRKLNCLAEVTINKRTAPDLYKGVIPITMESSGTLALNGDGQVVDWLVEMARFDQDTLFDRLAREGRLTRLTMMKTADIISDFHDMAEVITGWSGADGIRRTLALNANSFSRSCPDVFTRESLTHLNSKFDQRMDDVKSVLNQRSSAGLIRHCHGDLHLRNLCLFNDQPTLFDAIEFNDEFSHIDILYDLAFLLMDLDYEGHGEFANMVMNRYFDTSARSRIDPGNFQVLPLFLSIRSAVRSHVDAAQALTLDDPDLCEKRALAAKRYFEMADNYLDTKSPRLIAVGGLSGSGKSVFAQRLAPVISSAPGARVVRTDVIRKNLAGQSLHSRLTESGYTPEMNKRTYDEFYAEIRKCLNEGQTVIADAVFSRPSERDRIKSISEELSLPFGGLWLETPKEVLKERVASRKNDASDAGIAVVEQQSKYDLGHISWIKLDSSKSCEQTLKIGKGILGV